MTAPAEKRPKLYLILSEIWTMTDPRDLHRVVEYAAEAERAGFHGVMIGEHVVLGPSSAYKGLPDNPRDWLAAGNQDPRYPHPSGLHLLTAIASVTSKLRLMAGALLSPLRPPLLLAKELATIDLISQGRLIVIPGVSWQREEYEALNVPFGERGSILDEQLEIWERLWTNGSPVSYSGRHFQFSNIYVEPQPFRVGGPELWTGGRQFSPWAVRRAVRYSKGFFPVIAPSDEELAELGEAMSKAGRNLVDLELGAFLFGPPFRDSTGLLDLDAALRPAKDLYARGFSTFVIKPSQYIDDGAAVGDLCRTIIRKVEDLVRE
jgi:probable F420-dependent oxidoreductase